MKQKSDRDLALIVASWLREKGCTVSVLAHPLGWDVHYTLKEDVLPQPAVQVHNGRVIFPKGSQEDVVLAFLLEQ